MNLKDFLTENNSRRSRKIRKDFGTKYFHWNKIFHNRYIKFRLLKNSSEEYILLLNLLQLKHAITQFSIS